VRGLRGLRGPRLRIAAVLGSCTLIATGAAASRQPSTVDTAIISVSGEGPETFVLISGIVGGAAGFVRLREQLLQSPARVVVVDPYRLSIDSTDVTFDALAKRVDALLALRGVRQARVAGHAHGGGVALRLAALAPHRIDALYLLDVGALPVARTKVMSGALRLAPFIGALPGGKRFIEGRFVKGLRENSGSDAWLDSTTRRAYAAPLLANLGAAVRMAGRLSRAAEPESVSTVLSRVRAPVTMVLGMHPHPSAPDSAELAVLDALGSRLRVERLLNVGHFPHEEAATSVARILRQ
jgi:pimeloyl-ACP methyl ester carboxylesterase